MKNKFRGKRIDNDEWVYGNLIYSSDAYKEYETLIIPQKDADGFTTDYASNGENKESYGFDNWFCVISETVGQFIGVLNYKEIYEGDYLSVCGYSYEEPEEDWEGVISKGLFGWCLDGFNSNGDERWYPLYEIGGSYTTIYKLLGNIHDNSELLKDNTYES